MKRFAITGYGAAKDVFTEIDAEPRTVDGTHVRVALKAFGINPYDVIVRQGHMQQGHPLKFPYVLGNDGAGIVTEVGQEIQHLSVGDAVIVHAVGGTYGEEIVVPGGKVVKKAAQMSWAEAAGAVTPWVTAYNIVTHALGGAIGDVVAVQGASGAVGSLLVQLLKANGKTVYAVASKKNEDWVRSLGADQFSAYDTEDAGALFENQADTVINAVKGGRESETVLRIMKTGGNYVALNSLPAEQKKAGNYIDFAPSKDYSDQEALQALISLYDAHQVTINIANVYPFQLASVIDAHQELEGHPAVGKLVVER